MLACDHGICFLPAGIVWNILSYYGEAIHNHSHNHHYNKTDNRTECNEVETTKRQHIKPSVRVISLSDILSVTGCFSPEMYAIQGSRIDQE